MFHTGKQKDASHNHVSQEKIVNSTPNEGKNYKGHSCRRIVSYGSGGAHLEKTCDR